MGLTEPQRAALRALVAACPGRPIALVGACALGCNLDLRWRYTEDLDHSALDLGNGLSIGILSIPLIVFLKIVSFLDRPVERERDLADIAFTFQD